MANSCGGIFDYDGKAEKLAELNQILEDPKVWDDAERAQSLGREKKSLEAVVGTLSAKHLQIDGTPLFDSANTATLTSLAVACVIALIVACTRTSGASDSVSAMTMPTSTPYTYERSPGTQPVSAVCK